MLAPEQNCALKLRRIYAAKISTKEASLVVAEY